MHRIAGWLGQGEGDAQTRLEKMLACSSVAPPAHRLIAPSHALASSLSVGGDGGLAAAICGRPHFAEPGLAMLEPAMAVLKLWQMHGVDCPKHIHGNFSIAIVDVSTRRVFLALDRIGAEKLAFSPIAGGIVFASQADMVSSHPDVGSHLDPQGIFNFIYFYQVPAPGSIFRGVEKLLPAQWVEWNDGTLRRGFYWALHYRDQPRQDFAEESERLQSLLRESVSRSLGVDDVAAFLSGGTDSSTISGLLKDVTGRARTYSVGFDTAGFDEMEYARIAATRFGLESREYYLQKQDVLEVIPLIAQHYDEPFANESAVPTYFCARQAANDGFKVMLGGDGGDEIFGGNERYAKQKIFELYHQLPAVLRKGILEPVMSIPGMSALPPLRKLQSYIRQANVPLPERMETYNFIYRQPLQEMFDPDFLSQVDVAQPKTWLDEVYDRTDSTSFINRMLHLDLKFTLADNDLRKVGGMTEAAGVEVRYPLLDDALVEFSAEIPPDWKVKGRYLRWFFKKSLTGYLPDEIINKSKHGFGLPFGIWARDYAPLRERIEDRFESFKKRKILLPTFIDNIRNEHLSGHATYFGRMVWLILTLEEWLALRHFD